MTHTHLQSALEALYGLERRKDKLGLEGTRVLLEALGRPERRFHAVHVAGTNGKGSTCALIERVLREAGVRTGLFTSPHLVDFRERIRVNGRWADEGALFALLRRIESLPGGDDRTFFEVATALGFRTFADACVEWAVVEVGLGGRLDTTNVLSPELCVITGIGLDHTEILGPRAEDVAREKAGIVKPGVPVVLGDMSDAAREVVEAIARAQAAPIVEAADFARGAGHLAPVAARNLATARAAIATLRTVGVTIPVEAETRGLAAARWPGRFERCPDLPRLWWDGAHNPQGAALLGQVAREVAPFDALVFAASRDKDAAAMLEALAPLVPARRLFVTRSHSERARPAEELAAAGHAAGFQVVRSDDVVAACRAALASGSGPVLLAGSLFAVGEAMAEFGGAPGEQL